VSTSKWTTIQISNSCKRPNNAEQASSSVMYAQNIMWTHKTLYQAHHIAISYHTDHIRHIKLRYSTSLIIVRCHIDSSYSIAILYQTHHSAVLSWCGYTVLKISAISYMQLTTTSMNTPNLAQIIHDNIVLHRGIPMESVCYYMLLHLSLIK